MMKAKLFIVIALCLLIATSILVLNNNKNDAKAELCQIMSDIYAPQSMQQFKTSYKEHRGTLFTNEVADKLYVSTGDELTESDLSRTCTAQAYRSTAENNSEGSELYIVEVLFKNTASGVSKSLEYIFKVNERGIIYAYTLNVSDN